MHSFRAWAVSAWRPGPAIQVLFLILLSSAAAVRSEPLTQATASPASAAHAAASRAPAEQAAGSPTAASRAPAAQAAASPAPVSRAELPTDTLGISWPDLKGLVDRHPRLAASLCGVDAARGVAADAGSIPNPSLDAALTRPEGAPDPAAPREWSLELTIPLEWLAKRGSRVSAAEALVEASTEDAHATRLEVLLQLRELFVNLAHDQARVASLQALESQTSELARSVSRRVELGEARPTDATRVEIELEKIASDLDAARWARRAHQGQLRLWLGGGWPGELRVQADLASVPGVPDLDSALAAARSTHPSRLAARARVRSLESGLSVEKRARIPGVSLRAFRLAEPDRRAYGAGVTLDVPLWNWNSGRIAQARALLDAGRRDLEWQGREIESAVIEAHGSSVATAGTAVRYRDRILPRTESTALIMERAYALGETNLLELIDARRALVGTRLEYLSALAEAQLASSRLNALIGREDFQ
ncbi:MAG: TolC family protein [Candidatus Eisenbacteria bacterium]|nr:TolC family protein [Candidatus Eisenbacteria bacterium]